MIRKEATPPSPDTALQTILGNTVPPKDFYETLYQFNGFPEPLFKADSRALTRWQNDHRHLVIREDLRDLTQIREIGLIESLLELLPERIGSPLSINSLKNDLGVNFLTVQNWLKTLDRLFYLFALRPFSGRLTRTLKREEKIYFYDWAEMEEEKRFENFAAVHLLRTCAYWTDAGYGDFELFYVRDKEKREVDFCITNKKKPFWLVECKTSEKNMDNSLIYFHERLKPKYSFQIVHNLEAGALAQKTKEPIFLCAAPRFFAALP